MFFELSYLNRFIWDKFIGPDLESKGSDYAVWIIYDIILYFDVLPFICLLFFHYKNFKSEIKVLEVTEYYTSTEDQDDQVHLHPPSVNDMEEVVRLTQSSVQKSGNVSSSKNYSVHGNPLYVSLMGSIDK